MKLEYLSTLDEAIESQMLWLRDLNTVTKWRLWGAFYWFVIASLVFSLATGPAINKILIGFVFGGLIGGNLVFNAEKSLRRKIRKTILKKAGKFEPALAIVTLSGNKLEFSSRGTKVEFNLKEMKSVENTKHGLVLNFEEGSLLYLPNEAFKDNEKEKWLNTFNSHYQPHKK